MYTNILACIHTYKRVTRIHLKQAISYLNPGMGVFDIEYRDLGRTVAYGNQSVCVVAPLNSKCF
jgi:hypothetical protein